MQSASRFSSFIGKTIVSGSKSTGSMFPQVMAASTKDKFILNDKAFALMGVAQGSYVVMIDMNKGGIVNTTDPNSRFFITKGWERSKGTYEGAKIGKNGSFSYTGIYSAVMLQDPAVDACKIDDLVAKGLGVYVVSEAGNENFISKQKVTYNLVRFVQKDEETGETCDLFEVAPGVEPQAIYAMVEVKIEEHTPKAEGSEEEAEEVED